tara:strand:+ start:309 stop:1514 length:1206 start_codon:yes stop_codon:yes gene_type:complete
MSIFNTPPSTTDPLKLLQFFQEKRDASKGGVNGIMSDSNSNTDVDDFVASTYDALNNRRMLAMEEVAEERNAVLASYTAPAEASTISDSLEMASYTPEVDKDSEITKLIESLITESYGEEEEGNTSRALSTIDDSDTTGGVTTQGLMSPSSEYKTPRELRERSPIPITLNFLNKEGSDKGTVERDIYELAFDQGIKGVELKAFMAQVAHESKSFERIEEKNLSPANIQSILNADKEGKRLDPYGSVKKRFIIDGITRKSSSEAVNNSRYRDGVGVGNGDYASGDGSKYKGRGYIQLTGRDNYRDIGNDIGYDLESNPDLMLRPDVAKLASVAFWKRNVQTRNLNYTNTRAVTKAVNGGYNGLDDRKARFKKYSKGKEDESTLAPRLSQSPTKRPETKLVNN